MVVPALRVEGLGKRYRIGARSSFPTLRDAFADLMRRGSRSEAPDDRHIWAVRGVSFAVQPGEIVGVIGRNGAGKSTLLKLLARITPPTEGRAEIQGRIRSLLEVGTGFHPELTGRENIYVNGAILGMLRREIDEKFGEIVAFAEVEKFLDTPVKHYSSGMQVRLGFAVAAHLEPDVLLVDEVLAVGDASFQRRCLGKLDEVARSGRTVLFVSHNMPAVTRLCPRAILLDQGTVVQDGPSAQVIGTYLRSGLGTTAARAWEDLATAPGNEVVRLRSVRVRTEEGQTTEAVDIRRPVGIQMDYTVLTPGHVLVPNIHVFNEEGTCVFVAGDQDPDWKRRPRPVGEYSSTAWIPGNLLSEGCLVVGAAISTLDPVRVHVFERDAVAFHVVDTLEGGSARGDYAGNMPGVVRPLLTWTTHWIPPDDLGAARTREPVTP